jgi:hypothetical protein
MKSHSPNFIGFDIETRPRPELVEIFGKPYPDFDESNVKYGNTRDPVKRAALLSDKASEHDDGRASHWANLKERAALDPFTAEIACIGIISDDDGCPLVLKDGTEAHKLRMFWELFNRPEMSLTKFVFWSGCGDPAKKFDIDFLLTRSRILNVQVPLNVRSGRFYSSRIVDLAGEFLLHQRERYLSLSKAAELFGLYQKPDCRIFRKLKCDAVTGANFWMWFDGCADPEMPTPDQQTLALKYLYNDLLHLIPLAEHILS